LGNRAEVEGRCFSFIEPIRRQSEAIAADLMGEQEPFVPLPPLVRIKTASLPIALCAGGPSRSDDWHSIADDDHGSRLERLRGDAAPDFVLTGTFAQFGGELYRDRFGQGDSEPRRPAACRGQRPPVHMRRHSSSEPKGTLP
jgi:rubredoxin-NAD+ reductase